MSAEMNACVQAAQPDECSPLLDREREKWLTVDEAAYVLRTSTNTILQAIREGHLRLFACGKVWRIHVESLSECQKAIQEWKHK